MNVEISEKLIEDSQKIDAGIRRLQGKLTDVIDRITEDNADPQAIIQKHKDKLLEITTDLAEFLREQKEFDKTVQNAESEIAMMDSEIKKIMAQHKINIEDLNLDDDIKDGEANKENEI